MEKEVKIAVITGIFALIIAILQVHNGTDDSNKNDDSDKENKISGIEPNESKVPIIPENKPPKLIRFIPDKTSPQVSGMVIMWEADAIDLNDDDKIYYQFRLSGPSTHFKFEEQTSWNSDNTWKWKTSNKDIGNNQVQVQIRDGRHAPETGSDAQMNMDYTIEPEMTTYSIMVETGRDTAQGGATTARVDLTLKGKDVSVTKELEGPRNYLNPTEFTLNDKDVGDINEIRLSSDQLVNDHWYLKSIKITNENTGKVWTFEIDEELDKNNIEYIYYSE